MTETNISNNLNLFYMKRLFFFVSVALMVLATSCKKSDKNVVPTNDGDENVAYSYYVNTRNLCGKSVNDVVAGLKGMELNQETQTKYSKNFGKYAVEVSFTDVDDNNAVDILTITLLPSEDPKHEKLFTYDYVLALAKLINTEDKMLSDNVPCRFYGFYSEDKGEWLSRKFDDFVNGKDVTEQYLGGGSAYWLDNSIENYEPTEKETFTGMILTPVQMMDGTNPKDEYKIILTFAFKQVL